MSKIYESITELVGNTPLLHLNGYEKKYSLNARIYAKLEYFNPNQSSKDRIAVSMIEDAEKRGLIKPGDKIWEMTSGNTGIGVAAVAVSKGYKVRILLEDDANEERYQAIRAFGGEAVAFSEDPALKKALDNPDYSFVYAVKKFKESIVSENRDIFFLDQDHNAVNPLTHERTTGPEIWNDTKGDVDIFVAGTGTGGTISGTGKYLKEQNENIKIISVQPGPATRKNLENPDGIGIPGIHALDCIPEERIPQTMNMDIVDEFFNVESDESKQAARDVARTDGILVGESSGAALFAARTLAERKENEGKSIVVVFPDTGLRYFSTGLFEE